MRHPTPLCSKSGDVEDGSQVATGDRHPLKVCVPSVVVLDDPAFGHLVQADVDLSLSTGTKEKLTTDDDGRLQFLAKGRTVG